MAGENGGAMAALAEAWALLEEVAAHLRVRPLDHLGRAELLARLDAAIAKARGETTESLAPAGT